MTVDHTPCGFFASLSEALNFASIMTARTERQHKVVHPRPAVYTVVDDEAYEAHAEWLRNEVLKASLFAVPPSVFRRKEETKKKKNGPLVGSGRNRKNRRQPPLSASGADF